MPLQQPFIAIVIPSADPSVNAGAIHLQTLRDLTGGVPLDAEHDGLQPQGDTGRFVRLGFLAKGLEALKSSRVTLSEDRVHRQKWYVVLLIRIRVDHGSAPTGKQKRHLGSIDAILEIHFRQ
jgi:hypothetical protein